MKRGHFKVVEHANPTRIQTCFKTRTLTSAPYSPELKPCLLIRECAKLTLSAAQCSADLLPATTKTLASNRKALLLIQSETRRSYINLSPRPESLNVLKVVGSCAVIISGSIKIVPPNGGSAKDRLWKHNRTRYGTVMRKIRFKIFPLLPDNIITLKTF